MRTAILLTMLLATSAFAEHGILFKWTPSATPGVTSQALYCGLTAGGENSVTAIISFADNTTSQYLWTTGVGGTKYFCTVEAAIGNWSSVPSVEASAVFPIQPAPPTGLTATGQ